jgi:hypothetical protein
LSGGRGRFCYDFLPSSFGDKYLHKYEILCNTLNDKTLFPSPIGILNDCKMLQKFRRILFNSLKLSEEFSLWNFSLKHQKELFGK